MKKIADRIIKGKYVVFAVCAALLVVSCIFLPQIGVNYNLSDYLSKDTETRIALDIMEDEFGLTGNVQVMLSGVNESAAKEIKTMLSDIENVSQVEFDAESTNYFKDGKALYLHCLPADISGLSCPEGEVDNSVFDRYLVPLYKQASYKPYIIAAMIFLAQVKDPVKALMELDAADNKRKMF